jgi:hypothetical protein
MTEVVSAYVVVRTPPEYRNAFASKRQEPRRFLELRNRHDVLHDAEHVAFVPVEAGKPLQKVCIGMVSPEEDRGAAGGVRENVVEAPRIQFPSSRTLRGFRKALRLVRSFQRWGRETLVNLSRDNWWVASRMIPSDTETGKPYVLAPDPVEVQVQASVLVAQPLQNEALLPTDLRQHEAIVRSDQPGSCEAPFVVRSEASRLPEEKSWSLADVERRLIALSDADIAAAELELQDLEMSSWGPYGYDGDL